MKTFGVSFTNRRDLKFRKNSRNPRIYSCGSSISLVKAGKISHQLHVILGKAFLKKSIQLGNHLEFHRATDLQQKYCLLLNQDISENFQLGKLRLLALF